MTDAAGRRLSAADCRDTGRLAEFVKREISPNAWPIHGPALRAVIARNGLDLDEARGFQLSRARIAEILARFERQSLRAERMRGVANAFHTTHHNFEVLLRMLVLLWPHTESSPALPKRIESAPLIVYPSTAELTAVILGVTDALAAASVSPADLACSILAALGHDYGHTGGTDRFDADFSIMPLTHEESSERHVANFGLAQDIPVTLILRSLAGIRATTFYSRPGRDRVQAHTEFERCVTLADVMGCLLQPDKWLTHVGVPVFLEKLPFWRRRLRAIPDERARVLDRLDGLGADDPRHATWADKLRELSDEDDRIIKDIGEWLRSERGFFLFIESSRLRPVPHAIPLWGPILRDRIELIERVLSRGDLLGPLVAQGFPSFAETMERLANVSDLATWIATEDIHPNLRETLRLFLPDAIARLANT